MCILLFLILASSAFARISAAILPQDCKCPSNRTHLNGFIFGSNTDTAAWRRTAPRATPGSSCLRPDAFAHVNLLDVFTTTRKLERLLFNERLRCRGGGCVVVVGFDLDGYTIARRRGIPRCLAPAKRSTCGAPAGSLPPANIRPCG